jgi:hypothetical protein
MAAVGQMMDHSAMRFNQIGIISLVIIGYIFAIPLLVAFVGAVLLLGTLNPKLALFKQIYKQLIKPSGLMEAHVVEDDAAPHQFAQFIGALFLGMSAFFLFFGNKATGWVLSWLVVALAGLNLQLGFCAGCFMYYQLGKRDVPGFQKRQREITHD